jgi:hypothetical protein
MVAVLAWHNWDIGSDGKAVTSITDLASNIVAALLFHGKGPRQA